MELFSEDRISELEAKIDRLIKAYKSAKEEKDHLTARLQSLESENKELQERILATRGEREMIIDKVTRILEKIETAEV
jgi:chromosome segregation ATPase